MTETHAQAQNRAVDVDDVLANRSLSGLTVALTVLLALVLITDGFDIVVLGYLAPAISSEFGLSSLAMGWFITSAHVDRRKTADAALHLGTHGRVDRGFDFFDKRFAGIDVHTGLSVGNLFHDRDVISASLSLSISTTARSL